MKTEDLFETQNINDFKEFSGDLDISPESDLIVHNRFYKSDWELLPNGEIYRKTRHFTNKSMYYGNEYSSLPNYTSNFDVTAKMIEKFVGPYELSILVQKAFKIAEWRAFEIETPLFEQLPISLLKVFFEKYPNFGE